MSNDVDKIVEGTASTVGSLVFGVVALPFMVVGKVLEKIEESVM
jgi:hypothetical protein